MKTKIIPFDLETAKKIQSGEIEGRIVTKDGTLVKLKVNPKYGEHLITISRIDDYLEVNYNNAERLSWLNYQNLFIELPEESSKQYPYDRVKDKITDADWEEAKKTFPSSYNMQSAFISGIAYQICKEIDCKKVPKHEFKPFDKVLVRDSNNDEWICAIFSHTRYIQSRLYVRSTNGYNLQCIPYEGNEHLVGTTDKPKEE